jgi:hypothetical protein
MQKKLTISALYVILSTNLIILIKAMLEHGFEIGGCDNEDETKMTPLYLLIMQVSKVHARTVAIVYIYYVHTYFCTRGELHT